MQLELVEYYPFPEPKITKKGSEVIGTMHIFIDDFSLDIRFILCERLPNGKYRCCLPARKVMEDGKVVHVPVVNFTRPTINDTIVKFCRKHLRKYYTKPKEA